MGNAQQGELIAHPQICCDFGAPNKNTHGEHASVLMHAWKHLRGSMQYEAQKRFLQGKNGGPYGNGIRFNVVANRDVDMSWILRKLQILSTRDLYTSEPKRTGTMRTVAKGGKAKVAEQQPLPQYPDLLFRVVQPLAQRCVDYQPGVSQELLMR